MVTSFEKVLNGFVESADIGTGPHSLASLPGS